MMPYIDALRRAISIIQGRLKKSILIWVAVEELKLSYHDEGEKKIYIKRTHIQELT